MASVRVFMPDPLMMAHGSLPDQRVIDCSEGRAWNHASHI
jgi:hypothetical protein